MVEQYKDNGVWQCWDCINRGEISHDPPLDIKLSYGRTFVNLPECKIMHKYMTEVYGECKERKLAAK